MSAKSMFATSAWSAVCLALLVTAWLVAAQFVAPGELALWRTPWQVVSVIAVAGAVMPLALVHVGLVAWAEEAIQTLDGLQRLPKR